MRIAAGKVAAGGADVGHEQRVADQDLLAVDQVGHVRRGVAGHVQGGSLEIADPERFVRREQVIELRTVDAEFRLQIEQRLEHVLNFADRLANGDLAAQFAAQIRRGGEVVGVGVSLQQPLYLQVVHANESDDFVRLRGAGAPGGAVIIEYRIDDRALPAVGLIDHVAVGRGGGVEESFNQRGHGHEPVQEDEKSVMGCNTLCKNIMFAA